MKCRRVTCFTDFESDQILPKKGHRNSKSLETKNYVTNYARFTLYGLRWDV